MTDYIGEEAGWQGEFLKGLILDFDAMKERDIVNLESCQLNTKFAKEKAGFLLSLSKEGFQKEIANIYRASKASMLSWEEIVEMADGGMEFGSHACSHPFL